MKLNQLQSNKMLRKLRRITEIYVQGSVKLSTYERETAHSIGTQLEAGKLGTTNQQQFVDIVYKKATQAATLKVTFKDRT